MAKKDKPVKPKPVKKPTDGGVSTQGDTSGSGGGDHPVTKPPNP
jgi:hypothetical protein